MHRHAEAASLSRYRDSPISAISYPSAALACKPDIVYEPQDPCPPLRVETLSQQRKYQKLLKKSLKKKEQEQIKAQKQDEQLRRAFLAAEVAAERTKNAIARGEAIPRRSKSTKTIASEVMQKLNLNRRLSLKRPLSKLGRHVKKDKSNPPRWRTSVASRRYTTTSILRGSQMTLRSCLQNCPNTHPSKTLLGPKTTSR